MPVLKCDQCGRFTSHLYDVWCNPPQNGIDRQVCRKCAGAGSGIVSPPIDEVVSDE